MSSRQACSSTVWPGTNQKIQRKLQKHNNVFLVSCLRKISWIETVLFYKASCFVGTVLLHNSWILSTYLFSFPLKMSLFPSIKPPCATMQRLITPSINTSLSAPGSWGSSRNSRCLLLLLTSASTAVKLDHYDANLRRCCNPWEEPGSVHPIEKEEESESKERGGRGWEKMMSAWGQQRGRQTEIPAWV